MTMTMEDLKQEKELISPQASLSLFAGSWALAGAYDNRDPDLETVAFIEEGKVAFQKHVAEYESQIACVTT